MSTAVATPQETEVQFDPKAYTEARNAGKSAAEAREGATKPVEPEKPTDAAAEPAAAQPDSRRSLRRAERNAIREAAEWKGRFEQLQEQIKAGTAATPAADKPSEPQEPKRADFPAGENGTAEYLRAAAKWDRQQEQKAAAESSQQGEKSEELKSFLAEMDKKAETDMKSLKDWDAVLNAAKDHEDLPEFIPDKQPTLMGLLARSDMRAFVLYHFAKPENFEAFQKLLDMDPQQQISAFHRLEGRLEKLYDADRSEEKYENVQTEEPKKAAGAAEPEKGKEDRSHLAEAARPGEPQQDGKPAKPKPSSEVAAKGGTPAPDEPAIGSAAWMARRNQVQFGR